MLGGLCAVFGWWTWIQLATAIDIAEWLVDDMDEREQAKFHEWVRVVASLAFDAGHIGRKWRATDAQCESLKGYFDAGLQPDEGEQALFGVRH